MPDFSAPLSRRALLAGTAFGLAGLTGAADAAQKHDHHAAKKTATAPAETTGGVPLVFPPRVEIAPDTVFELVASPATHTFVKGKPVSIIGYGGTYMGPALVVRRGTTAHVRLVNRLERPTNVHWHGLLVEGRFDGGTHPGIAPGETWDATLAVDQPAATLWYHAHVHGHTTKDVHDGLAGLLLVEDDVSAGLGLPSNWGVDDLPLVLQDRDFDETGRPTMPPIEASLEHGFRGHTPIVNGIADAVARVPERLVRLRLLNASGARTWRLAFEDRRAFHLIATDAGFLEAPVELTFLPLAPGERAEILVDFAVGAIALVTEPDRHEHREGVSVALMPDVLPGTTRVVAFETTRADGASPKLPATLASLAPLPESTLGIPRRRFELRVRPGMEASQGVAGHDHKHMHEAPAAEADPHAAHGATAVAAGPPPRLTINGKSFAMGRIDEQVRRGVTEIWEIVSPEMAHPFHLHGAHFRVLGEDGERPKLWNGGLKDTVLVENSAELLVTFTRPADATAPFVYHCHLLEHEDGGMMGAFTVG